MALAIVSTSTVSSIVVNASITLGGGTNLSSATVAGGNLTLRADNADSATNPGTAGNQGGASDGLPQDPAVFLPFATISWLITAMKEALYQKAR